MLGNIVLFYFVLFSLRALVHYTVNLLILRKREELILYFFFFAISQNHLTTCIECCHPHGHPITLRMNLSHPSHKIYPRYHRHCDKKQGKFIFGTSAQTLYTSVLLPGFLLEIQQCHFQVLCYSAYQAYPPDSILCPHLATSYPFIHSISLISDKKKTIKCNLVKIGCPFLLLFTWAFLIQKVSVLCNIGIMAKGGNILKY